MKKTRVALVKLGGFKHEITWGRISKWNSDLFSVESVTALEVLPEFDYQDEYLDAKLTKEQNRKILKSVQGCDLTIGVTEVRFDDNFYIHRLAQNTAIISLNGVCDFLEEKEISLENFIVNQIYTLLAAWKRFDSLTHTQILTVSHQDTRRCLFDLNGDVRDVIYNTEKPILCNQCKSELSSGVLPEGFVKKLEGELKRLDKPLFSKIENAIKKRPWFSLALAIFSTIGLNVVSNIGTAYYLSAESNGEREGEILPDFKDSISINRMDDAKSSIIRDSSIVIENKRE